jgi:formate hydrogenlyase transcriptional activator
MEKNDFFREAALTICGNLKIEEAMLSLINVLIKVMPVYEIFLQYYDKEFKAMRTIAHTNETQYSRLDLLTPLSKEAIQMTENPPADRDIFLFEDPQAFPISKEMQQFHRVQSASLIVMALKGIAETIGYIVFLTDETETFNDTHLEWALMLKEPLVIAMSNALRHREVLKYNELLSDDNRYLYGEMRRLSGDEIVGANFGLRDVMYKVQQVATLDSPVLLLGETGTGKDVIANAIHYSSSRSDGPFVSVNCGAIPETLIDSELFGHEKGAFTGALSQKRGRFERADTGTIFLDEIGELPPQAQVRLLTVLQKREIERVGGIKTIPLNIRIIAATNRNLEEMVQARQFREDLWFRLNVFPVLIPPLRDRRSDITALLQHFITLKSKELKLTAIPKVSPDAIDQLLDYSWPGNVRELENVVERELILNPSGPLEFKGMILPLKKESGSLQNHFPDTDNLDEITSQHIRRILSKTAGKIHGAGGAAELLGINPSTLRNRMKKLGIEYGMKS